MMKQNLFFRLLTAAFCFNLLGGHASASEQSVFSDDEIQLFTINVSNALKWSGLDVSLFRIDTGIGLHDVSDFWIARFPSGESQKKDGIILVREDLATNRRFVKIIGLAISAQNGFCLPNGWYQFKARTYKKSQWYESEPRLGDTFIMDLGDIIDLGNADNSSYTPNPAHDDDEINPADDQSAMPLSPEHWDGNLEDVD